LVSGPYSLDFIRPIQTRFHYDFHPSLINILANPLYKRYHIVIYKLCVLFNFRFQILFHYALLTVASITRQQIFSTFTHVTGSLSLFYSYLALVVGCHFLQTLLGSTLLMLLIKKKLLDLLPSMEFNFFYNFALIGLDKRSLAATSLISIDLFSSCY